MPRAHRAAADRARALWRGQRGGRGFATLPPGEGANASCPRAGRGGDRSRPRRRRPGRRASRRLRARRARRAGRARARAEDAMTGAVSPASATGSSTVAAAQSAAVVAPSASLLPPPGALSDPLSMIAYFQSNDQQLGLDEGTKRIQGLQKETQQAFQKEQQAIADLVQAEQHKSFWDSLGGVFSEIAKVAGVVASIAAAVATCGAGSPLAAVAVAGAVMST